LKEENKLTVHTQYKRTWKTKTN